VRRIAECSGGFSLCLGNGLIGLKKIKGWAVAQPFILWLLEIRNLTANSTTSRFVAGDVFLLARLATRAAHEGFRQGDREPSADGRD
jgi:hypothetical protein